MVNSGNNHKYGAIQVFCDPKNYLSHRASRDENHTLRFPSKFEYKVYCKLRSYLARVNPKYSNERFTLELQFKIVLLGKTGVMKSSIDHVVDFVIRDTQSSVNPILYIEAKGYFLSEYLNKMRLMEGLKQPIHNRYLVVSEKEPPNGYAAKHATPDKLDEALYYLGVK